MVRLSVLQKDFQWHKQKASDEFFYVIEGKLSVDFEDGTEEIAPGEMITVSKGITRRIRSTEIPEPVLPEGYRFEFFREGNEKEWAEIESAVLEFSTPGEGIDYFTREYLPYGEELKKRTLLLISPEGENVGTATAWWSSKDDKRIQSIDWVGVKPSHQKSGLGRALIHKITSLSVRIDGDNDIYIHTQTWSCQAIRLYLRSGYKILTSGTFGNYDNDYELALPILNERI